MVYGGASARGSYTAGVQRREARTLDQTDRLAPHAICVGCVLSTRRIRNGAGVSKPCGALYGRKYLLSPERHSHGTKFRLFYYRAHCERGLRRFKDSLLSFKRANGHAKQRYEQKRRRLSAIEKIPEVLRVRLARERFAIISIARILGGGLSWNAIHQGRLMRAQELGLSAETLLMETGQEPLRLFIRSNMAIARRRAARPRLVKLMRQ